ncbi:MAG: amino-acid N-acetyltransferase [Cycloclasticus sp.]
MLNDSAFIIHKFGGVKPLAAAINKDPATIYRWTYPKSKGGTGGIIPSSAIGKITEAARLLNITLDDDNAKLQLAKEYGLNAPVHPHQFVNWFRSTAPYIHAHRGKTFVINFSGEAVDDDHFSDLVEDFVLLNSLGIKLILVHGIRPQLEKKILAHGQTSHVFQHLRVTDRDTLELAKEAVGTVRTNIEAQLSSSLAKTPMAGAGISVASGNFISAKPIGIINGVDYQFTGEVRRVKSDSIAESLTSGRIILVSPLGYSPGGEVFNLRSEEIATAIATEIKADKLILMTERTELLTDKNELIRQLTTEQAETFLESSDDQQDDAYLHLQEAIRASKLGVKRIHLINRKINGGIQLELFTRQGAGTLISVKPFEDARQATIDDINGIIELIRPLEAHGLLTYRSAETIEQDIAKFHVIAQEGLITTCAALYEYPQASMGELACVAVHPSYRTGERGDYLLKMIERKAISMGLTKLFVLTTQSSHWFEERGFKLAPIDDLPEEKREDYNHARRSSILIKDLI